MDAIPSGVGQMGEKTEVRISTILSFDPDFNAYHRLTDNMPPTCVIKF